MKLDSIQDSTRYVIADKHKGNVMPGTKAEMWRNIFLNSGAEVIGCIFGNELEVEGSGIKVTKAVYCRDSIKVNINSKLEKEYSADDEINFLSTVISEDSLLMGEQQINTRFHSDIYIDKINLKNAIVYGNIYAENAIIKNSIILGGIYCDGRLKLENSIVFTFNVNKAILGKNVNILSPVVFSKSKIEINDKVKAITFCNIFENEKKKKTKGSIWLDEKDIIRLKNENKKENNPKYALSIVERILNSTKLIDSYKLNRHLINMISLKTHLNENNKNLFMNFTINKLEDRLWSIINHNKEIEEIKSEFSFEDLLADLESSLKNTNLSANNKL